MAASEPETQDVEDYVLTLFPDQRGPGLGDAAPPDATGLFLTLHSYSQLVLWPWGHTYDPSPNDAQLATLGRKFAYYNSYTPQQSSDLYPTTGATDDWAYGELGVAAYTFEVGTAFFQDCGSFENETSIARCGRREELLTLDGYPQTASEKRRDTWLKENAWPWARPVGAGEAIGSDQLTVVVCGYVFTANWRYTAIGDGSIGNVSTYISEMVESDCEFLSAGNINENTLGVKKEPSIPSRTYDVISEQAGLGDAGGNPWRFYVDNDRRANYQMIDTTPVYYLRGGRLFASSGGSQEIVPWIVKPGVARDMNYPISRSEYGGWLPDARDFYIEEVEAGPGGLALKTELFEESERLAGAAGLRASAGG